MSGTGGGTGTTVTFTRDEKIENMAYKAGWSEDQIKRTRLIDVTRFVDGEKAKEMLLNQKKTADANATTGTDTPRMATPRPPTPSSSSSADFSAYFTPRPDTRRQTSATKPRTSIGTPSPSPIASPEPPSLSSSPPSSASILDFPSAAYHRFEVIVDQRRPLRRCYEKKQKILKLQYKLDGEEYLLIENLDDQVKLRALRTELQNLISEVREAIDLRSTILSNHFTAHTGQDPSDKERSVSHHMTVKVNRLTKMFNEMNSVLTSW